MNAPLLLTLGMIVVVLGILVFKLHAFLALIAGALVVAVLTPTRATYLTAVRASAEELVQSDAGSLAIHAKPHRFPDGAILTIVPGKTDFARGNGKLKFIDRSPTPDFQILDGYSP